MRAILAGGGTGGHVIPALAIANQLQKSYDAEVLFIGTARGIENRLVPAAGFSLQLVRVGAFICSEAGFYDQSHLARHFKRVCGSTPGKYRGDRVGDSPLDRRSA